MATALRPAPAPPIRLDYGQAFREAAQLVHESLRSLGISWTADAEQHAVCTLLIAADKHGYLEMWQSPQPPAAPAAPVQPKPQAATVTPMPSRGGPDLTNLLSASIDQARARRAAVPPPPQPDKTKAEPWFPVMLRAFREVEAELPPEVYAAILEWYGAKNGQFSTDQQHRAIGCYVALKQARDEYRTRVAADPASFESFEAGL